jgi:RNA polymerase sigma factor (sigma-70 family)
MSNEDPRREAVPGTDAELIQRFRNATTAARSSRPHGHDTTQKPGSGIDANDARTTEPPARLSDAEEDDAAAAFAELFRRHHAAGRRLALRLAGPSMADELVAEAFTRILALMRRGEGPRAAFRAYLGLTIRSLHVNHVRVDRRHQWVGDDFVLEELLSDPAIGDGNDARFETSTVAAAFRDLPTRWRAVLWLTAVEGHSHKAAGELLGLRESAVRVLAFRAREGLRRSYLQRHLRTDLEVTCRKFAPLLPAYVRGGLTPSRRRLVEEHLRGCSTCPAAVADLSQVNTHLGALLFPAALGLAALPAVETPHPLIALCTTEPLKAIAFVSAAAAAAVLIATIALSNDAGPLRDTRTRISGSQGAGQTHSDPTYTASTSPLAPHEHNPAPSRSSGHVSGDASGGDSPTGTGLPEHHDASLEDGWRRNSEPSASHRPPATPPADPSVVPGVDPAIGAVTVFRLSKQFGGRWVHLTIPVRDASPSVELRFVWRGVSDYTVHAPGMFGGWTCRPVTDGVSCAVAGPDTAKPIGIDLLVGTTAEITASITAPQDARPDNNATTIRLSE